MGSIRYFYVSTVVALLIGSGCSDAKDEDSRSPITPVPLAGLLMNPNIPPGARVSVIGYFGGNFLYLTKDHAEVTDYASSITIADRSTGALIYKSPCQANYVKVTGELKRLESGELVLDNIDVIKYADSRKDCYRSPAPQ